MNGEVTVLQPIRPEEIAAFKLTLLPDVVIEVFNTLVATRFSGQSAVVSQDEVITALLERGVIQSKQEALDRHFLDVEPIYRAAGWHVAYDKPDFNESRSALFTFSPA
jgi:hypothetical protein